MENDETLGNLEAGEEEIVNRIKILAVDDEPDMEELIKQKFRRKIRKGVYEFVFAQNGNQALKQLSDNPDVGLILSDINMPEMDGLTLLSRVHDMKIPTLKTVIVSAYGDMENIRTAMNRGAFDFVTKPIDFEDLEITITKTADHVTEQMKAVKEHEKLNSIQQDLNIAREIQLSILPKVFPPFPAKTQFEIYAMTDPAKDVGGDFYDFFLLDENHLGFVIADVSGKGIPAALFMAVSRTLIRGTALHEKSPSDCLSLVNNLLCQESLNSMFVTVFYGILDITSGEITYSNGGHNPPYIFSKSDGSVKLLDRTGNTALGLFEDLPYSDKTIKLNPGDYIFTYTDGVTEAMNIDNQEFGEERLVSTLSQCMNNSCQEMISKVVKNVKEFTTGAVQSDDITTLCLRYNG